MLSVLRGASPPQSMHAPRTWSQARPRAVLTAGPVRVRVHANREGASVELLFRSGRHRRGPSVVVVAALVAVLVAGSPFRSLRAFEAVPDTARAAWVSPDSTEAISGSRDAAGPTPGRPEGPAPGVEAILAAYNARIHDAGERIGSLRVAQEMIEPQEDGSLKRARAVLSYAKGAGMTRDETFSELSYPAGQYTLSSLIGPELDPSEYAVELLGTEDVDGVLCYRLRVEALERDVDHMDGTVWIAADTFGPVRVTGEVSDPPFPVTRIKLDKRFELGSPGLWLLRMHTGEVEVSLLLTSRQGLRHIFYDDYIVCEDAPENNARAK